MYFSATTAKASLISKRSTLDSGHPILDRKLFDLDFAHPIFISGDHARHSCLDNPVKELGDLMLELLKLCGERFSLRSGLGETPVPDLFQHRARDLA